MRVAKILFPLLALVGWALSLGAPAQAQTAGQLLQGLSQSDRAALLEQFAADSATGDRSVSDAADPRSDERQARRDRENRSIDDERVEEALAEGDSVLVDIQLIVDRPAQVIERGAGQLPLIVPAIEAPKLSIEQLERLEAMIDKIRSGNPYVLGEAGQLRLPGFPPIVLGGLDDELATARVSAEKAFANLQLSIKRLPVEKTGIARLKPFGYDLFTESPSTFAPVTNIPAPADYLVGPGDQLVIQLFGAKDRTLRLTVDRDGQVNFPELGPIAVTGLRFEQVRQVIERRVGEQMIGVQANISLGDTRAIQVLVTGDVNFAGTYTVSGLATITSAIYAAGGIAPTGSFRQIEHRRAGALVGKLDLYNLLLKGDSSADQSLRAGDVIFVRPLGATVAVDGAVRRPAIYETRAQDTLLDLIDWAGGATPDADLSDVTVVALDQTGQRRASGVNMTLDTARRSVVGGVSEVIIRSLSSRIESAVFVQGHVDQVGTRSWFDGMTIRDALPSLSAFREGADTQYVLIRRELDDRTIRVLSVDMLSLLTSVGDAPAPALAPRDTILVFDGRSPRSEILRPLLQELRTQAGATRRTEIVTIGGEVRWPGDYPLEEGMRVSDLIRAGGGLSDRAYQDVAEITRIELSQDSQRAEKQSFEVNLAAALQAIPDDNLFLRSRDSLLVKPVPQLLEQATILVQGEVMFPGEYPIKIGETLRSVIERAGGLTSQGFASGAVFTRESLREREQQRITELERRLRQDLATTLLGSIQAGVSSSMQPTASPQAFGLLDQLETTEAVGRLVIDLDSVLAGDVGSPGDILLRDGDRLVIPVIPQEVTVIGEVQLATSHLYQPGLGLNDYIGLSGGATERGDVGRIYVIKADGRVQTTSRSWWSVRANRTDQRLAPGDTIVVPPDLTRLPPLPLWQAVTSIIYNASVAVAAIGSL